MYFRAYISKHLKLGISSNLFLCAFYSHCFLRVSTRKQSTIVRILKLVLSTNGGNYLIFFMVAFRDKAIIFRVFFLSGSYCHIALFSIIIFSEILYSVIKTFYCLYFNSGTKFSKYTLIWGQKYLCKLIVKLTRFQLKCF